jgi:hypothetical protein
MDAERRGKAEADVKRRRATGKLPFPDFDEEEREQLEVILDYPPEGISRLRAALIGGKRRRSRKPRRLEDHRGSRSTPSGSDASHPPFGSLCALLLSFHAPVFLPL